MNYFRRIWRYFRPYLGLASITAVVIVLSSLVALLIPWPFKVLIDSVLGDKPVPYVFHWTRDNKSVLVLSVVGAGLLIVLAEQALNILHNYLTTKLDQYMTLDFRSELFRHTERLSLAFHDQKRSGMLIYAINYMASSAAGLVMTVPPLAEKSGLTLIGMLFITIRLDWQLALLSLTVVPFLYLSVGAYAKFIQPRLQTVMGLEGESLAIIHEAISMLKVIVAFGREDHEYQRFRKQGEKAVEARVGLTVRQTLFTLAVSTITAIGTALVTALGAHHVLSGKLTLGQLTIFIAYLAMIYRPLEAISFTIGSLQDKFVALRIAFEILDNEPEIRDDPGAISMKRCLGSIDFQNVGFHYEGRIDTLRNISFQAGEGEVIAIVGPTGAGKSTLVSLIPRFYDVQDGGVRIDGHDIRKISLKSLRGHISIVLQEPLLFSGTILDNIRYGRLEATDAEVMQAAKQANAHDFISALPQGYQTELGERGTHVSGGERQRIAIARAFLKDARILILDEPTSSIDSKTETVILDALDRLMAGRTTLMIAHRLSTIRRADQILVLDQGQLIEKGTHDALMLHGGLYRQLYEMQTRQPHAADIDGEVAEPVAEVQ